ncbi:hypothetical protein PybrP1_011836 [[Pythium] brassicae (nom. inval.)]|nr:hypothetical protein PybrP1_011836 [[Pythium] brassicae (nom. inval.)]
MILTPFNANAFHAIMAILCLLAGLALAAGGYRFHRIAMPVCALFIGGDYAASVISAIADGYGGETEYWIAFFFGSFPFIAAAAYQVKSGVAVTGFCAGVALTAMMLEMSELSDGEGSATVMVVWMTITGLLVGMLAFKMPRPGMIASMSFVGAYVLMNGVRHFVNKHLKMRSAWWTMCAITLILFAVFIGVQQFLTARGIDHSAARADDFDDEKDESKYAGADTPSRNKEQLAPATNLVALV